MSLTEIFAELNETKNIDKVVFTKILMEVFKQAVIKQYGSDENFEIIVNIQTGDLEIWRTRNVVADEDFKDPKKEIPLSEAQKFDPQYEPGETFSEKIDLKSFDRRVITSLRQNLINKLNQLEKENFYNKYKDKVGEIVSAEIDTINKNEIILKDDEQFELILPKSEQIPSEKYIKGDTLKVLIKKVEMKNNKPRVTVTRTSPDFLKKLFELEIPEIEDGLITIVDVVRIPGEKAKVAVDAYDERIDAVGACIGIKGARIHGISREVRNENIDVINFTTNPILYIQRALAPAKIENIEIDEENKIARVYLYPEEVAKAVGKKGNNLKLAMELTKYQIEIYRIVDEDEEDIDIEEFNDEIDDWIIQELKRVGIDTAKQFLEANLEILADMSDLELETLQFIEEIIKKRLNN